MSRAVITESLLTSIANAIRAKTGGSSQMTPAQMATAIAQISAEIPDFIYDPAGTYPASYTWPFPSMRQYQFAHPSGRDSSTPFFTNFDFGDIVTIPESALRASVLSDAPKAFDKLTAVSGSHVTTVGDNAFRCCGALQSASFPEATIIGPYAFMYCNHLTDVSCPKITEIKTMGFSQCAALASIDFPRLTKLDSYAFAGTGFVTFSHDGITLLDAGVFNGCQNLVSVMLGGTYPQIKISTFQLCKKLARIDFASQALTSIANAFNSCAALDTLIIRRTDSVVSLTGANLTGSKIAGGTGYIYVPDALVNDYKSATNWSTYAAQIKGLSELPA